VTTTNRSDIGYKREQYSPATAVFFNSINGPTTVTSSKTKSGGPVLGWKKLIRDSEDATGGYTLDIVNDGHVRGSASCSFLNMNNGGKYTVGTVTGVVHKNPVLGLPILSSNTADTQARIAFMQKVRNSRRSFQSGVFLGELRETIHQITHPAQALRKAITSYSSAVKKAARRARGRRSVAKAISGTWLENSYGWRPLFQDIDDGMKALAAIPRVIGDPISGFFKDSNKGSPFSFTEVCAGFGVRSRAYDEFTTFVLYKGLVAYENDNPAPDWKQNWGLTLSDFAPTVWELIPYSFLVDYFSNIGNVIDSASMGQVSLRWGFRTSFTKAQRRIISTACVNQNGFPSSWKFTPISADVTVPEHSRISMSRTSISSVSVGIADITVKVPGVDNWRKWANIAALATEKIL
jgi:hypothetical protein